jgi:WD40 repeat protein
MASRRWRPAAVIGTVVLGGVALTGLPAGAVTPGTNGTIMFVANEPCNPVESFCNEAGQQTRAVFEMRPDGTGVKKVLGQNFWVDSPSQNGNGSRILYAATFGDPEIYKTRRTSIDFDGYVDDGCGMSWAPDSSWLTYTGEQGCYATLGLRTLPYPAGGVGDLTGDIRTSNGEGGFGQLTNHPADDRDPDWSPNGQWIAFASNRSGTYQIWAAHPDGSGLHKVTPDGWEKSFPAFSPDSSRILFTRASGSSSDLWTVKLDGTGLKQVTKTAEFETQATYSPDGSRLVVARQPSRADENGSNLFKMRVDGTDVVRLTTVGSARWAHTDPFWNNVPQR